LESSRTKNFYYPIRSGRLNNNGEGKIVNCETEDSKIIKFLKEKGLK
jgi:hypothetical protein